ncbi:MAG TPA: FimV/HubP family polar landmark protein, partial [Burkholderiales bacterium]|nr:FimV/HubP family polar landmark protein [Burkholderiales bacterium]
MVFLTGPADSFKTSVAARLCCLLLALVAPSAGATAGTSAPLILAQGAAATAPAAPSAAIRETVGAWAKAWSARDVEGYLGFYSPAFKPADGQSRSAWAKLRRVRVAGPRFIEVTISNIEVLQRDDRRAAATFEQQYRSDRFQDRVTKTLEFAREGARWLIVEERSGSAVTETAPAPAKAEAKSKAEPKPEPKPEPAAAPAPAPAAAAAPAAKRGISAGLGTLQVLSNLGQPLRAEIDLLSLRASERENVNARLAPIETFREAGVEFHHALADLKLAIELRDGKPIILLTTRRPVNEPLLELLVELEWGSGRFVREYAILLDPPIYIPPPPADAVMGPTPATAPAPAPPTAVAVPGAPPSPPGAAAPAAQYRVSQGDTLAEIAAKRRYPGVTLDQMMIALFRANPEAFIGGDIDLLRA